MASKTSRQVGWIKPLARFALALALSALASVGGAFPSVAQAQLATSEYFADRMVLQSAQPITVWGSAAPQAEVEVSLGGKTGQAVAGATGQWQVQLPAFPASATPLELKVSSGSEVRTVKDILVGDVWLISGQSNVVLPLAGTTEWPQVKTAPANLLVRVCKLPGTYAQAPANGFARKLTWDVLAPPKVGPYLSAVGYHFVSQVQPQIGVPLGLVQASVGGTQVEQWTPQEALQAVAPENPLLAQHMAAKAKQEADRAAKIGNTEMGATALYNGVIHPFRLAKFKGVVWYQGEANSRSKRDYRPVLKAFVRAWRGVFGQPELPFVLVQLPNFGLPKDDGWNRVQEAQALTAQEMGLALTVNVDQGSPETIHPPNKAVVGQRAALAALQHVYGQNVEGTSPRVATVRFVGELATVEFTGFKGGLQLKGDAILGFELAGADGKYVPATAQIQGRTVQVKAQGVAQPTAVRYLWTPSPGAITLYSAAGLPVGPFRWPTPAEGK